MRLLLSAGADPTTGAHDVTLRRPDNTIYKAQNDHVGITARDLLPRKGKKVPKDLR